MPCFHPYTGWQSPDGKHFTLHKQTRADQNRLDIPCGGCLGCRMAYAKHWAIRNHHEYTQHDRAAWVTLTYDDEHLPPTLTKPDLANYIRRLRKPRAARPIRFFACGEYGEQRGRPHYHAIIYGLDAGADGDRLHNTWGRGHTDVTPVTPAIINYTAGYTAKKIGWKENIREQVDPTTGEVYTWQPPFLQMSRRPGIGAHARAHIPSWRLYAIHNGYKTSVPRYYHQAWIDQATDNEIQQLILEKQKLARSRDTDTRLKEDQRIAAEQIAITKHNLTAQKRKL